MLSRLSNKTQSDIRYMNHKRVKPQMTNTKQRERVDSFVDNRRGKHEESLTADVYQHVQLKDFPLDDAVI